MCAMLAERTIRFSMALPSLDHEHMEQECEAEQSFCSDPVHRALNMITRASEPLGKLSSKRGGVFAQRYGGGGVRRR